MVWLCLWHFFYNGCCFLLRIPWSHLAKQMFKSRGLWLLIQGQGNEISFSDGRFENCMLGRGRRTGRNYDWNGRNKSFRSLPQFIHVRSCARVYRVSVEVSTVLEERQDDITVQSMKGTLAARPSELIATVDLTENRFKTKSNRLGRCPRT